MPENIMTSFWFFFESERFLSYLRPRPHQKIQKRFFMAVSCEITQINFLFPIPSCSWENQSLYMSATFFMNFVWLFVSSLLLFLQPSVAFYRSPINFYEFVLGFCFRFTYNYATTSGLVQEYYGLTNTRQAEDWSTDQTEDNDNDLELTTGYTTLIIRDMSVLEPVELKCI